MKRKKIDQLDSAYKTVEIAVKSIIVKGDRRPINKRHVEKLVKDIAADRLRTPISVCRDSNGNIVVVAGAHRLEAFKRLKRKKIPVIFLNEDEAEGWSITENMLHLGDDYLERCVGFARLAEIRIGHVAGKKGGVQPHDKGINKISHEFGVSRRTVSRMLKVSTLDDLVKVSLREHRLGGKRSFLQWLSNLPNRATQIQAISRRMADCAEKNAPEKAKEKMTLDGRKANASQGESGQIKRPLGSKGKRDSWLSGFQDLEKLWRKSGLKEQLAGQDIKTKTAFVRKMFSAKVIQRAHEANAE